MSTRPAVTERHLAILNELAEIGMVLARRLSDLPPLVGQNTGRDFELIARAVRRSILLFHAIADGKLPPAPTPRPERDTAHERTSSGRGDATMRLDSLDRLDNIAAPFEQIVTAIIRDIQAALATSHGPSDVGPQPVPAGIIPERPEADAADLD